MRRTLLLVILFFCSGTCGLIYELVWTRLLILVMGATTFAITTVLVAFMSGLALGGYLASRYVPRLRQPGRFYGVLEIVIGLYGILLPFLLELAVPIYKALYPVLGDHFFLLTLTRFAISTVLLILPAACMGATLPVLVRHLVSGGGEGIGAPIALLYAINAFGAVTGVLLSGFVLLPAIGLMNTTFVAAALNMLIGLTAITFLKGSAEVPFTGPEGPGAPVSSSDTEVRRYEGRDDEPTLATSYGPFIRGMIVVAMGISGFAALGYQVGWTRVLIMSVGSSTYAFTCILGAFILGLAIGSAAIKPFVDRIKNPLLILGLMEVGIALSVVAALPMFGKMSDTVLNLLDRYGDSFMSVLGMEFLVITGLIIVPTVLMGAIFPLASKAVARSRADAGGAVGRVYAINTLGTIIGSFCAGFLLIPSPAIGIQKTILIGVWLNGLLGCGLLLAAKPTAKGTRAVMTLACLALIVGGVVANEPWNKQQLVRSAFLHQPTNPGTVDYYREGIDTTVSVTNQHPGRSLRVNSKADGSMFIGDTTTMVLAGHLPCLFAPEGRQSCIIGLGIGSTLCSMTKYPSYAQIDCAEISKAVIDANPHFADFVDHVLDDPRVNVIRADGRNHLLLTDQKYDVIMSQPSNPWIAGVSNLFTREFFELCEQRLTPNGRICIWAQSYSMSLSDFRMIIRTISRGFGFITLWRGNTTDYMIIASRKPFAESLSRFEATLSTPTISEDLSRISLNTPARILSQYVTGGQALKDWAEQAPNGRINTDDNAALELSAPKYLLRSEFIQIATSLLEIENDPLQTMFHLDVPKEHAEKLRRTYTPMREAYKFVVQAIVSERDGDPMRSLSLLRRAYDLSDRDPRIYGRLVGAISSHLERFSAENRADLVRIVRSKSAGVLAPDLHPRTIEYQAGDLAAYYIRQGQFALERKDFAESEKLTRTAIEISPDLWECYDALGVVLEKAGRLDEACEVFKLAASKDRATGAPLLKLGIVYVKSGNTEAALDALRRAIERDPNDQALVVKALKWEAAALDNSANPNPGR